MFQLSPQNTLAYGSTPVASVGVEDRLVFLKKVYGLLAASLFTATVGAYLGAGPLLPVVAPNIFLLFIVEIGLIFFASYAAQKPGLNMIALFSFTTVSGLTLGPVLAMYVMAGRSHIITEAFLLTALIFTALTLYVVFSRKDFSFMSGFLFTGLIIVVVGGLLNALVFQSPMGQFMISGAVVFLFSGFILYDTSNILRNYSTDQHVSATLALYLDVLNLFVALLSILGLARDD